MKGFEEENKSLIFFTINVNISNIFNHLFNELLVYILL